MAFTRLDPLHHIADLKSAKLWSLDWAQETWPDAEFNFVVLRKTAAGYDVAGFSRSAHEAFKHRRELAKDGSKWFIRAKRIVERRIEADGDDDAALDYFRDKHAEGVGIEDIPRHLRRGYQAFVRGRRSAR